MSGVVVYGVGTSMFAKQPQLSTDDLVWQAVLEALADAGEAEIGAVYVGTVFGSPGVAQRALHTLGIVDVPIVTVENACASGTTAFHEAREAITAGRHDWVLALGIELMTAAVRRRDPPGPDRHRRRTGMLMPSLYAMSAGRYLHEGWVTERQLAQVSVKNHLHAEGNPRAQYSGATASRRSSARG